MSVLVPSKVIRCFDVEFPVKLVKFGFGVLGLCSCCDGCVCVSGRVCVPGFTVFCGLRGTLWCFMRCVAFLGIQVFIGHY